MNALNVLDWKRNAEGDSFCYLCNARTESRIICEKNIHRTLIYHCMYIDISLYVHYISIFEHISVEMPLVLYWNITYSSFMVTSFLPHYVHN
jgi:hypothetical protein